MNHAPSRPALISPVAYPVPAPSQVSVATTERSSSSSLGIPVTAFSGNPANPQGAALRDSRPSWPEPVRSHPVSFEPSPRILVRSVPAPVLRAPVPRRPAPSFSKTKGVVRLVNGLAVAPPDAPAVVHRAVAAGNRLQKLPYKWGGGHAKLNDTGYDCSGAVSYVLREAGLMKNQMTSRGLLNYGQSGKGEWITVWARDGHALMTVGGLRLDTGGSSTRTGPRWKTKSRSYKGLFARHPAGL